MVTLESGVGNYIRIKDKLYSYFAGNDYLGLAGHPGVVEDLCAAVKRYGINFSASRQTTGTSRLHLELERELAAFKQKEDAVVFASGYVGNMLLLHGLKDKYSTVIADSMAHPSILDGIPRSISSVHIYNHLDVAHLEELLKKYENHRPLIITDGIFALTGEVAPLDRIYTIAGKYNALLVVDDAHSTGVLGKNGRGTPEFFNLDGAEGIYQSETMSKALGAYGGFISASSEVIKNVRSRSAFYGASTALPPPIVAAGISAVKTFIRQPQLRETVLMNARKVRKGIQNLGFETTDAPTPIIPVLFDTATGAKSLSAYLEENSIIAPSIDYPVKTGKFIVRITVTANHSDGQIETLLLELKAWKEKAGAGV